MRRCLILYGMTCIIGQVLALREISVAFQGNEITYGAALAAWLSLVACGSGLIGRLAERFALGLSTFTLTLAGGGILVPLTLVLARSVRWMVMGESGVIPPFGAIIMAAALVLAPLCLVLGFFYALACAIAMRGAEPATRAATRVYVFEAVGTFIGGLLFTLLLIHVFDAFQIALGIAALDCLAAFAVWWHGKRREQSWGWALLAGFAISAAALFSPAGTVFDFASQALRFPGRVLRASRDTPYGRVDVVENVGQIEFYQSGALAGATHMDRTGEETTLIPLLAHPAPRRVLMIGGHLAGALRKALSIPWVEVDYVELDPALIQMARLFSRPADLAALESPRVRVFTNVDGRRFVKRTRTQYDVIISAVPNPTTGVINRLYTAEFFQEARRAMSDNGVLALTLDGSPAYMSAPYRALAASVLRTLEHAFPDGSVTALPRDSGIAFLASPSESLAHPNGDTWAQRMRQWGLRPMWLTAGWPSTRR